MAAVIDRKLIWTKTTLTYQFTNNAPTADGGAFTQDVARSEFRKACEAWSEPSGLSFQEVDSGDVDISITWTRLDGAGDVLGDCEYPKGNNQPIKMRFDNSEDWTKAGVTLTAYSFLAVALHELGHGLGLQHSATPSAVMYPFAQAQFIPRLELSTDDKDGILYLYKEQKGQMMLINETDTNASWFSFNSNDGVKLIALDSGDLGPGEFKMYKPVENGTHKYFIRFTEAGGGRELAGAIGPNECMISLYLEGSNGYHVQIS